MYEKWCSVLDAVPARDATLEEELQKQQQNDQLRIQFAEKANALGAFIEEKHTALADLSMQGMGTMEACWELALILHLYIHLSCIFPLQEQLAAVKQFQSDVMAHQPEVDDIEATNQVCH